MRLQRHRRAGLVALTLADTALALTRVFAAPDPIGPSFADRLWSGLAAVRSRLGL
jgi:hypothetical protein